MATYVRVKDVELGKEDGSASVLIKVEELKDMRARENRMVSLIQELKSTVGRVEGKAEKANVLLNMLNQPRVNLERIKPEEANENDGVNDRQSEHSEHIRQHQGSSSSPSSHSSTQWDAAGMTEQTSTSAASRHNLSMPLPRMSSRKRRPEDDDLDEDSNSDNKIQCLPLKRFSKYVDDTDDEMDTPNSDNKAAAGVRTKQQTPPPATTKRPQRMPPVDYTENFIYMADRSDTPVVVRSPARKRTANDGRSAVTVTPKPSNSSNKESVRKRQPKSSARDTDSPNVTEQSPSTPETTKRPTPQSKGYPVKHQMFVSDGAVVWWESIPKGGLKLSKKKYRKKMHDFIASIWVPGTSVEDLCENPEDPSDQFKDVFSSLLSFAVYEEIGMVNTGGIIYMKGNYNLANDDRTLADFIRDLPEPAKSSAKLCCELMFSADVPEAEQFAVVRKAVEDLKDTITCHPE